MNDDDILEIDSPLEQAVDADDDEVDEITLQQWSDDRQPSALNPVANIAMDMPIHYQAKIKPRSSLLHYPESLPYECESLSQFDARLHSICWRLVVCVQTRDFDIGFVQWNHRLQCLLSLKYPIEQKTLARLARLYYHVALLPGLEPRLVDLAAKTCMTLLGGRKKLTIAHLILPWRPLYDLLYYELTYKTREPTSSVITDTLLDLAEDAQRFFDPDEAEAMLQELMPSIDGISKDSLIGATGLLVHMLPITHPQRWLPTMFRLWESFSSTVFDEQMLDLCARVAEMHVEDPRMSSQKSKDEMGMFADKQREQHESQAPISESGLWNDVGVFTEHQFALIMTKCLRSAGLPIGATNSQEKKSAIEAMSSSHPLKKPAEKSQSFATILVYSMYKDSDSPSATPAGVASPNGSSTPTSRTTYLAGSKALDALGRFIQATESYFHPSNWGFWAWPLSGFVKSLTWEFAKRWHEEEKPECRTPKAFRLTPAIRHEFCTALRTVCLLTMFSKDPLTISAAQSSLKRLALLEPQVILPPVLDRAYSSLEALETTHRTSSIIMTLSALSLPLVSHDHYKEGAKHLVPLLHLCIPGIDLNDSVKTMSTAMFILTACTTIKVDDMTRPEISTTPDSDGEDEESEAVRLSTAGFEDWTTSFFHRVLALFEALPEEGKGGRAGGKLEEQVISTVLAACDAVCSSMSDHLFDINLKIVTNFCLNSVVAQAVRVTGSLVSCFARHRPERVLKALVRPCSQNIRLELQQGASSTRTTSTSTPVASDVALHWNSSVLLGSLTFAGPHLLEYKDDLLQLMDVMCKKTYTERGYTFAAMLVQRVLLVLVGIYVNDQRFLNPDEWQQSEKNSNSHLLWGKTYAVKDVKMQWHVPSDDEIAFALEILKTIVVPRLDEVERLQNDDLPRDKVWSNEFCRNLVVARLAFIATNNMVKEDEAGGGVPLLDAGDDVPNFLKVGPRFESGFLFTDPSEERYQEVKAFKLRFGNVLHLASKKTQDSGAEDQIDCVKLLLRSIRSYMISYSFNVEDYNAFSRAVTLFRSLATIHPRQKKYPRVFWVRRAAYYHASRGRLNSFHRQRSPLDDKLIAQVLEFTMSNYVAIRRVAQNALESISQHYDGTRLLCLNTLLQTVQMSTSDDRIKGALYVLGSKHMSSLGLLDARYSTEYIVTLLRAQHHSKPSIQKLLRGVIHDFYIRFSEPCTIRDTIRYPDLDEAAHLLVSDLDPKNSVPKTLVDLVASKRAQRLQRIDSTTIELTSALYSFVQATDTHWTFSIFAAQLLRTLVRRDKPIDPKIAAFFTRQLTSENPSMRRVCQKAVTRILYFVKLQTLCKSAKELLRGKCKVENHPCKQREAMKPPSEAWKVHHFAAFRDPDVTDNTRLYDKDAPGWLVWGRKETYYLAPPAQGQIFDWVCKDALAAIQAELTSSHWSGIMHHFAQEKDRETLLDESMIFVKSIFQVFGISQLENIKETVLELVSQRDRHKQRAAAEVIAGLYRGSKHWSRAHADEMWGWLGDILPKIFQECTPDSQQAWQDSIEYMLIRRDPRRALTMVEMIVKAAREVFTSSSSPYEQVKVHSLLRTLFLSLYVKFTPWTDEILNLYVEHFDTDFNEVRSLVGANVTDLELQRVGPSFSSMDTLLTICAQDPDAGSLLAGHERGQALQERFASLDARLRVLKKERTPKAQGISKYDLFALTTLRWIDETLSDHRNTAMAGSVIDFIPTIFDFATIHDHTELSSRARTLLLSKISTHLYTNVNDVCRLVGKLLEIIVDSKSTWRTQFDALRVLQVVYFHNIFYLDAELVSHVIKTLVDLLSNSHLEVRNSASATLSGIVLCSQRNMIQSLRQQFTGVVSKHHRLPKRGTPDFPAALTELHAGVLGATALIGAFPYSVPKWMPSFICDTVARHQDSPDPVGQTCKKMAADFKRTHQDTWQEDKELFTSEQLLEYNEWGGRSGKCEKLVAFERACTDIVYRLLCIIISNTTGICIITT